jgi:KUP system potassium uptake protein
LATAATRPATPHAPISPRTAALTLAALGIVYGDIGTSPLYALRECFATLEPTRGNVLGVLSLITWSLILVITVKYVGFVMRADNRGEGGILALAALATSARRGALVSREAMVVFGLIGTALLYGDGIITPAVSVLGAVEGLRVAAPALENWVVPIAAIILLVLFSVQSHGTGKVGTFLGPVTLLWSIVIAALGVAGITHEPSVLAGILPWHAITFFVHNGVAGFIILASVFLVVTGGEALYADMGHFGKRPIRLGWFCVVLPALLLNYFGQGALVFARPEAAENPFYLLAPEWLRFPLIALATAAACIASQALITGAFSLTMQAVQLGYLPRVRIEHTSSAMMGQVYVPVVNLALMLGCLALVIGFGSSTALAGAYGIAVSSTMLLTTLLLYVVARRIWGWSVTVASLVCGFFLIIDIAFWLANLTKIPHGVWVPLIIASALFLLMSTWRTGRLIVKRVSEGRTLDVPTFLQSLHRANLARVPGTAVFMYGGEGTPPALLHSLKHYRVLHERNVILRVETKDQPYVPDDARLVVTKHADDFFQIVIRSGFMETMDVPAVLRKANIAGLPFSPMDTSYFLRHETLIAKGRILPRWRGHIFSWMMRNARGAASFFGLPSNRVVELGAHLDL